MTVVIVKYNILLIFVNIILTFLKNDGHFKVALIVTLLMKKERKNVGGFIVFRRPGAFKFINYVN